MEFPITNPVHIFAIVALIILVAPILLDKLRLPGVVGLILAGVLVGPNGFNILNKDSSIVLFGTVGIVYIMFLSGLEVDFADFKRSSRRSLVFGLLTFAIPQGIGTLVGYYVLDFSLTSAVLLASMFASHTLLAYPTASKLGIARDEAVLVAIGGTLVTNTISLSILAVVASGARGGLDGMFWFRMVVAFTMFCLAMFWVIPWIAGWFFRSIESEGISQFMFILALVFLCASVADLAGIEPVIGAFLAGLSISRLVPSGSTLMNRINFVGNSLFIPYFLIYVGMLVDIRVLFGEFSSFKVAVIMIVVAMGTKWAAAYLAQVFFGYSKPQREVIFGLSNAQAANTLAAVLVGYKLGLLNRDVLNGTIGMIFVTCLVSAFAVDRAGRKLAMNLGLGKERDAKDIQRILVPISKPDSIKPLLDFAFLVKSPASAEPVFPLTVVSDDEDAQRKLAVAKKMLHGALDHASSAETEARLITRIDVSAAAGIIRVIKEMRISCVVMGWGLSNSAKEYLLGGLHDHLLEQSDCMLVVHGLRSPVNVVKRLVVVFVPNLEFEAGFGECLDLLFSLRRSLKSSLFIHGLETTLEHARSYSRSLADPVDLHFVAYTNWEDMPIVCQRELKEESDLLLFVNARRGCVSWKDGVEDYARKLHRLLPASNLALLYASRPEPKAEHMPKLIM